MAAGIPVVCAAVGANVDIVRDGVDGITALTDADWLNGLAELCESTERREWMGANGRLRAANSYSLSIATPVLASCINKLNSK